MLITIGLLGLYIVTILLAIYYLMFKVYANKTLHPIYAIMITGKDTCRTEYAKLAVQNFFNQTYPNKYLIIINHGHRNVMPQSNINLPNVIEIYIDKKHMKLGDLRNIALEIVPYNALWMPWDDDDYRAPELMFELYKKVKHNILVSLSTRCEYNKLTEYIWQIFMHHGMPIFLAKKHYKLRYLSKDTMEDTQILTDAKSIGHVKIIKNKPDIYIRLIHNNNTSLYVDKTKDNIVNVYNSIYKEKELDKHTKDIVKKIISDYYKQVSKEC